MEFAPAERTPTLDASNPIRADASARRQALDNRLQSHAGLSNDLIQAAQRKAVEDLLASALGFHKATVPQTCQVGTDPRLGLANRAHQLADAALSLVEELQDVQPRRISENPEEARRSSAISSGHDRGIHIWKAGYNIHSPSALGLRDPGGDQ